MQLYYRKITALFPKKYQKILKSKIISHYLRDFFIIVLILSALAQLQILVYLDGQYKKSMLFEDGLKDDYSYWESVSSQFPNIPDVLYNASLSAYNAGYKSDAIKYIEKALRIDPLFEKASNLRKEIVGS